MKSPTSDSDSPRQSLKIVVVTTLELAQSDGRPLDGAAVEAQRARAEALRSGLLEAGYDILAAIPGDMHLIDRIAMLQPDMIIIDAQSDARDVLEDLVLATRDAPRPLVLFTEAGEASELAAAMAAGVSAYVVAGLQSARVKPVLEVAMARFVADQKLRNELSDTKTKLAERKTIERAKGYLMQRHGLSEQQAFERLRRQAMEKNMKLAELAQRILDVSDLLG
ncbi:MULTISPECIES: ANTAR domain-containing response regulator [unclassified Undibacterium]|uniref:ANTAR domain-containing response regulator n=1 Tax=unclassified Undibacterium TaxID=2630295 RepID=UPI002AC9035C|nr:MULTISPECIES: ANTAR domain-containing protein [unclassified Undibacterium]MEB0139405.1 ANTAR domain-containing protein [Undibacterium sp. CCC2.1]MEB0173796.1 ANTAR domain-containing protein [Undibacterium sp. CCC1.1]MEB0177435.1 ANTAR domain-containing protein [Undibacterium sp. CCC3.4]MEB0216606.1 ANTAR domain-containing protein [Undibacterium sp. 5I2]WPX44024.1 ANTAR domain-containing protein [Undibacterium sp. CCC3.4]